MRILIVGASGLVGSALARAAGRAGHEVIGTVGSFSGPIEGAASLVRVDLTDESAGRRLVLECAPAAIVNCAAVSVPEVCESEPALSDALNVRLPAMLAAAARQTGARFVHISSEQVFDGSRNTPYAATDAVSPINRYGRQKRASEQEVQQIAEDLGVTVRAPLLMGNSAAGRRSTHERLLADWAAGRAARLYRDEFRQPCTAENLADVLLELCGRAEIHGIQHWAGLDLISRYDLGLRIRDRFGLSPGEAPIVAVARADNPEAASRRQACLGLDIAPLSVHLRTRPQSLAEQLPGLIVPEPCRLWFDARRQV